MDLKLLEKLLTTPSVTGCELAIQKMLINELKDVEEDIRDMKNIYEVRHITHAV